MALKRYSLIPCVSLAISSLLLPSSIHAIFNPAPSDSAGVVERVIQSEYDGKQIPPERNIPLIEIDLPGEQLQFPKNLLSVKIDQICFSGNTVFSNEELNKLVSDFLDRLITMQDIREICVIVREYYVQNGYFVARAYPPVQDINNGLLKIEIIEGKLGTIEVECNQFYSTAFIERHFENLRCDPINYDDFQKALMILNQNTNLNAGAIFIKGKEFGTADVVIRVIDSRPVNFYADYNDYGTKGTSKNLYGGRFDYGNLLRYGDTFSLVMVGGTPLENLKFIDAIYTIPVNFSGGTLQMSYLYSRFRVREFTPLHLGGSAAIADVTYNQAIQRSRTLSTDIYLSFDYKQVKNFELGTTVTYDKLRVLGLGAHFDGTDSWNGRNVADVAIYGGIPKFLGGSHAVDKHASRPGGGGGFVQFNTYYRRIQSIHRRSYFLFNFIGQYSPYKLTLPQQMYIGGVDTVRGYNTAVALGDDGYVLSGEFRVTPSFTDKIGKYVQLAAFFDHGGVFLKHGKVEDQRNFTALTGTGVGLRANGPKGFNFSLDVGFPLTKEKRTAIAQWYIKLAWSTF